MKSTKTRFTKKLKSIKAVDYLKQQDRVLRVISAADGLADFLPKITNSITHITNGSIRKVPQKLEEETIDESNLANDDEEASEGFANDKENIIGPRLNRNDRDLGDCRDGRPEISTRSDSDTRRTSFGSKFRRPDSDSSSLFDPNLLEAFELATECYRRISRSIRETFIEEEGLKIDDFFTLLATGDAEGEERADEETLGKDENTLPETFEEEREAAGKEEDAGKDRYALQRTCQSGRETEVDEETVGKDENALPETINEDREAGIDNEEAGIAVPGASNSGIKQDIEEEDVEKDESALPETIEEDREVGAEEVYSGKYVKFPAPSEGGRETESDEEEDNVGKNEIALHDPLLRFEERCPPGGEDSVVFYTTTLRGIRKTFDDCNKIRFLLDSFRVLYYERDVSMHREYKEELRRITKDKSILPALFVKGKCIGGAQQVLGLHEQGKLRVLFQGVPMNRTKCCDCNGVRFLMCYSCRGSHKVFVSDDGERSVCLVCNENGLIVCPSCCL